MAPVRSFELDEGTSLAWELSPEVAGLIGALGGAVVTLVAVAVTEFGQGRRAKLAAKEAAETRSERRREELWADSRSLVSKLQELFAEVLEASQRQPDPFGPPEIEFEDGFPEWWHERTLQTTIDVANVPFAPYREALEQVRVGISVAFNLARVTDYARSYREAVSSISRLGLDVTSALLRDEPAIPEPVEGRLAVLSAKLREADEFYHDELESYRNPKGHQI